MRKFYSRKIFDEKLLKANAVFGLFPANTINDDDIEVSISEKEKNPYLFITPPQQLKKREGVPSFALADFIAPKEIKIQDYTRRLLCVYGVWNQRISGGL